MVYRIVAALLIIMAVAVSGCGTKDTSTGPEKIPRLQVDAKAPDGSINWRSYQTLYTSCGTFYLSYPSDFSGPIPAGYGRIGQTDPSYYCSNVIGTVGDPTSDE